MLIDAHQHFWQIDARHGYWPPAELTAIHRDFAPADLTPLLHQNHVRGTVLVQTLPSPADTAYMLDLATHNPFILGVVGWVDLESADAPDRIARLATNPRLKGVRPMLQDIDDTRWIANRVLPPTVRALIDHGLCFDALVTPRHLPALLDFAERHPDLPMVIDHAGKPPIAAGIIEPWLSDMSALAALPQMHCKLSGLLTEAGTNADIGSVRPYVDALLALFGPERLLWGSDWPVLRLAGDYGGWLAMCQQLLANLPEPELAAVFGLNAIRFYGLDVAAQDPEHPAFMADAEGNP